MTKWSIQRNRGKGSYWDSKNDGQSRSMLSSIPNCAKAPAKYKGRNTIFSFLSILALPVFDKFSFSRCLQFFVIPVQA